MSDDSLPPLTSEQIKELQFSPDEVARFEQNLGEAFSWFLGDWIDGALPPERLRELDIHSRKIRLAFNRLDQVGIEPELTGMYIGFFWKVGGEEWQLTL